MPGYEVSLASGLGAPRSVPNEVIDRINKEINAAIADPVMKTRLADLGNVPAPMTPADYVKLIAEETEKWAKVIRAANLKPE